MDLAEGTTLGPYRLSRRLGAGGMGEVFLATDSRLGRSVALKVMSSDVTENPSLRGRFEKEARAIAALSHPNICALYDIGADSGVSFMVMELLEGQTLAERVAEGPILLDEAIPLIDGLCDALAAAHERSIVHRDLKPSNIMLTPRGVKVLDFGVAKFDVPTTGANEATMLQTRPGMLLGTLRYMSPEQASADEVTPASDMFSLGVVLFEALTGRHPFPAATNRAMLHAILAEPAPAPSSIRPDLPPAIDALILQLLEKDAAERPAAVDVRAALRQLAAPAAAPVAVRPARNVVGRAKELEELASILTPGRSRMVVVAGEAGLGKSTLVESFLEQMRGRTIVAVGRCSDRLAGAEAYLPIVEALGALVTPEYAPVLRRLAPSWHSQVTSGGEVAPATLGDAGPDRMKRELTALFDELTRAKPMILFIDDMHWADISTVDLLAYLAPRLEALRLSIVLTYRPADLLVQKHPFLQVKQDLQGRGICHEIELAFLERADVAAYIEREFPGNRFPPGFADVVYARTEGSPLFMADLLRYLRNQGVIEERDGRATLPSELEDVQKELPESVRGMIDRKMGRLDEGDLALVRAAAVQGVEFDSVTVAEALKLDPVDVEERLEQLDRVHRLVTATAEIELPDGTPAMRYRFVHVLYQNASFGALGPSRRTALARGLAESLEARYGRRAAEISAQLAILFEGGRWFEKAAEYFLVAAEHADRLYASQEAMSLARRGLDALGRARDEEIRARFEPRLLEVLGNGVERLGQHEEALRAFEGALAKLPGDASQRIASLQRKIGAVRTVQRRYADAESAFRASEEALDRLEERGTAWWSLWVQVQLERAWSFYWQGDVPGIESLVERVKPSVEEKGTALQQTQFTAVQILAHLRAFRYRVGPETVRLSEKNVELALASGDPYQIGSARFQRGFCHMWRNELEEAESFLSAAAESADAIEDRVLQSRCYSYLTVTARKRRDLDATEARNAKAMEIARAAGMLEYTAVALGNAAWIAREKGETGDAERLAREGRRILDGLPMAHGALVWIPLFPLFAVLVGDGRLAEAADAARKLIEPDKHKLPDDLEEALERASGAREDAAAFAKALELAREHRYL